MTIKEAAVQCLNTGLTGWGMVEFAQKLVHDNMTYSYTHSLDLPRRAFSRGRGYCWQQAKSLHILLKMLGFQSFLVYAVQNMIPEKLYEGVRIKAHNSGHVWCRVRIDGTEKDICPGSSGNRPGVLHFTPISPIKKWNPFVAFGSYWGSLYVNHKRYKAIQALKQKA